MDLETRVRRSPAAAWREIDGDVAIVSIDVNRVRLLNRVGGFVWSHCDGRTVADVAGEVRARYNLAEETARRDTLDFVQDLVARGLLLVER